MNFFLFNCSKKHSKNSLENALLVLEMIDKVNLSNKKKSFVNLS